MSEVWFIRHAESEANAGLPTTSQTFISLTPVGIKQAHAISKVFQFAPSLIVTSPHIRTRQTAQPTIERFPNTPCVEWHIQEFTFLSPLRCKNTTAKDRQPMIDEYWKKCDPFYNDGDGAESFADFVNRVWNVIKYFEKPLHEDTAIFSHGLFIRAVIWALLLGGEKECIQSMGRFNIFCEAVEMSNGAILKCFSESGSLYFGKMLTEHLK